MNLIYIHAFLVNSFSCDFLAETSQITISNNVNRYINTFLFTAFLQLKMFVCLKSCSEYEPHFPESYCYKLDEFSKISWHFNILFQLFQNIYPLGIQVPNLGLLSERLGIIPCYFFYRISFPFFPFYFVFGYLMFSSFIFMFSCIILLVHLGFPLFSHIYLFCYFVNLWHNLFVFCWILYWECSLFT